ncbi:hypoxanthine phosphoribosyltransferase [Desulfurivibrio dismutans]|uniref:hypoxanthine phosphoribosyltransferase n=1 Tax=Desulfurivibrio dismutans TaxID=1398908 RepID=UPI0023DACBFB|nr:hypoxanthine phosphoribosyltransferase [Desulfurivibrio alkaliphilus]MDF1614252.1 hypoxanthine phosphoribosyltransferase [Desulfurivibrio alkaliphilus]
MFSAEQIALRVAELGRQISADYHGRELLVVGVLNGAFIFTADLVRALAIPVTVDFIRAASYGQASSSCGTVRLSKDVELPLAGLHVLLVEDIVDSGHTLTRLKKHFTAGGVASLRVCALIDKKERREAEVVVDYPGFTVEYGFLVGYGLDYAEQYRQYPAIHRLAEEHVKS